MAAPEAGTQKKKKEREREAASFRGGKYRGIDPFSEAFQNPSCLTSSLLMPSIHFPTKLPRKTEVPMP